MQAISVFDMFKIGVGPSSSHTMGPWRAAQQFLAVLGQSDLEKVERIKVEFFGSLAKTGKGHGTDIAVQLGLMNHEPETIEVSLLETYIENIAKTNRLDLGLAQRQIDFSPESDLIFHMDKTLPFHPNGLRFTALTSGQTLREETYFSIGGGFVVQENCTEKLVDKAPCPYPVNTAEELLKHCDSTGMSIAELVLFNEKTWRESTEIDERLTAIKDSMLNCIHRGCTTSGILPGGLGVHRRAVDMAKNLFGKECPSDLDSFLNELCHEQVQFQKVLDWVSCFALAVNEENAAFGRVVTAPTNGAAGVIPAVLLYCIAFCDADEDCWRDFLLVAGEIGSIFKKCATISAAMGGCQAEIGVSSAMAAAALCACIGGTPAQSCEAAEIAMEHHLGLTCDPIGGLVQIPCIERNAMGAIKAITAAQMAKQRSAANAKVSLDAVIRTMWETAQDMNAKYKETSEGGLAVQISVNIAEC